jgi:uncharacterized phage protein gp47/JayE
MAKILNEWVGYLDRSYQTIKNSVLSKVTNSNPEMTDHSESNIFVIIISMFSGIAEQLNYYIDNLARESFLATALRRSSVIKHARSLDYRVKTRNPETADILLTWTDGGGTPTPTPSAFNLQAGSYVENLSGLRFTLLADVNIPMGVGTSQVTMAQITQFTNQVLGLTNNSKNQKISLGLSYVHKSSDVVISGQAYAEVDTFAHSADTDFHYIVEVYEDGNAYLVFGDGINGVIPPNGFNVQVTYQTTLGADGRAGSGTLTENVTLLGLPIDTDATSNNPNNSSGGSAYEDADGLRVNAALSIRNLNRMVTGGDYKTLLEAEPGISKAKVNFCCGKLIDIYIVPDGGGVASGSLISAAQTVANSKKMITTFPTIRPSGDTRLIIKINVTAKLGRDLSVTKTDVENALLDYGSVENQNINGSVRLSDILAKIDNVDRVDFADLIFLYTIPYARPVNHTNVLVWTNETKVASFEKVNWKVVYNQGAGTFSITRNGAFVGNITLGAKFVASDNIFEFTISAGSYNDGDEWTFASYTYNNNITISDFTIPTVQLSDLDITVFPADPEGDDIC